VKKVVEEQLDPLQSRRERKRRLEHLGEKIEYWQEDRRRSAKSHRHTRLRELHERGIFLSRLRKCHGQLWRCSAIRWS
jgi:hypothetical protein